MKAFVSRLGPAMSDFLSYKHAWAINILLLQFIFVS